VDPPAPQPGHRRGRAGALPRAPVGAALPAGPPTRCCAPS
jgi:hypothetical protein